MFTDKVGGSGTVPLYLYLDTNDTYTENLKSLFNILQLSILNLKFI